MAEVGCVKLKRRNFGAINNEKNLSWIEHVIGLELEKHPVKIGWMEPIMNMTKQ